ncbi:MAG: fumarylacetoacetase [Gemmatimonadaceae bacterium]|nr:fumarylacetoacetase [Gemmatimonadaceae bacterium]
MTHAINATHDPALRSWVASANESDTDFPVQNLPFGVFSDGPGDASRAGVAIGDQILDVSACVREGLLDASVTAAACAEPRLNRLMSLGRPALSSLRARLSEILRSDTATGAAAASMSERILVPMSAAAMKVPAAIGDYTDFYASIHHATNVGAMFRPDNPLLPNYKYIPIGYHGRSSSIVTSGTAVRRPAGQTRAADAAEPSFGASQMLDYESELGFFVGQGNPQGEPISLDRADEHIFGFCLVNDWSARDVQAWEYQPLGPFLAKNFATTISPWVVTAEAVAPYRVPAASRPAGDPAPLAYLASDGDAARGGVNAMLEVFLASAEMRARSIPAIRLSQASFALMYWTVGQMLAHHASNGCNLRPGDLLASGTVSGPAPDSRGCLLELTSRGALPLTLPTGEQRMFLHDGDEIIMRGRLHAESRPRLGFGECRGIILPVTGQS